MWRSCCRGAQRDKLPTEATVCRHWAECSDEHTPNGLSSCCHARPNRQRMQAWQRVDRQEAALLMACPSKSLTYLGRMYHLLLTSSNSCAHSCCCCWLSFAGAEQPTTMRPPGTDTPAGVAVAHSCWAAHGRGIAGSADQRPAARSKISPLSAGPPRVSLAEAPVAGAAAASSS